jgi:hypothetical protein
MVTSALIGQVFHWVPLKITVPRSKIIWIIKVRSPVTECYGYGTFWKVCPRENTRCKIDRNLITPIRISFFCRFIQCLDFLTARHPNDAWQRLPYVYVHEQDTFQIKHSYNCRLPQNIFIYLSIYLCLYSPFFGADRFSVSIIYTVGRTPWKGEQPVTRPLPTQNNRKETSMLPSWIRTHDPNVRGGEDCSCLKPRDHCDGWRHLYNCRL